MTSKKTNGDFLFSEFPPVSARQWKQKIQADLKGEDYQKLITPTLEGIDIKPFYHRETYRSTGAFFPAGRFRIAVDCPDDCSLSDAKYFLRHRAKRLRMPLTSLHTPEIFGSLAQYMEWFRPRADRLALETARNHKGGTLVLSPLTHLARTGNWAVNEQTDRQRLLDILDARPDAVVSVDGSLFADAGANAVQQLAYVITQAQTYIQWGIPATRLRPALAVGSRYFMEIAKLRSLRYLWHQLITDAPVQLAVRPTLRNKTLRDPYNNMLRTGMEMMAAVLGGANLITNLPYDMLLRRNPDSVRLAVNQLLLLRHEAPFAETPGFYEGSYFTEELILQLSAKAGELIRQTEKAGGYLKQLYEGIIQRKIRENARKEQELFDRGEIVLIGVNKHPLPGESKPAYLPGAFVRRQKRKTLIPPVVPRRLAEKAEWEWLQNSTP